MVWKDGSTDPENNLPVVFLTIDTEVCVGQFRDGFFYDVFGKQYDEDSVRCWTTPVDMFMEVVALSDELKKYKRNNF